MEHLDDRRSRRCHAAAARSLRARLSTAAFPSHGGATMAENIFAIVTDDMSAYGARIPVGAGSAVPITDRPIVLGQRHSAGSCAVVISGDDSHPNEIYSASVVGGKLKFQPLTHQNDALFAELQLAHDRGSALREQGRHRSARPADEAGGLRRRHEDSDAAAHPRRSERPGPALVQRSSGSVFAANGYAVLAVNYRGSSGRGAKFSKAIFADWGHYEVDDLLGEGRSGREDGRGDPDKLGVGGWSYGGILTDYMIATDTRFKAATSGAGTRLHGRVLRHRSVHHPVRLRDRPAVGTEGVGDLSEDLLSVPARRSHQDADAVSRRRARLQRAGAGRRSRCTRRCAASTSTPSW